MFNMFKYCCQDIFQNNFQLSSSLTIHKQKHLLFCFPKKKDNYCPCAIDHLWGYPGLKNINLPQRRIHNISIDSKSAMRGGTILPKGEWLQVYLTKCRIKLSQFCKMLNDSIEVDFTKCCMIPSRLFKKSIYAMSIYTMSITQNVDIRNVD